MASPDVFLSSPRVARRMSHVAGRSSPELPEIHDIIKTQKNARPPLKSGSRASAIPDDALTGFTTARGLWQSAQAAEQPSTSSLLQTADPIYLSGEDDSVCIIESPKKVAKSPRKPRTTRRKKEAAPLPAPATAPVPLEASTPQTPSKDQPWKKYRASPRSIRTSPFSDRVDHDAPPSAQIPVEEPRLLETDSVSKHFQTKRAATKKFDKESSPASEPMIMEAAPLRRLDWTPPAKDQHINLEDEPAGDASAARMRHIGSPGKEPQVGFRDLLQSYNCSDSVAQPSADGTKDPPAGFGKRKLIEPVIVQETSASERSRSTSPTKKKGPKKPRTITELATAAYRPEEPEAPPPPASLLNFYVTASQGIDNSTKGKGKGKPRKRAPPKTSKKKVPPSKPELLSPGAALKHVANQDFVFGTSSQLAQEKSPTFLRNIHTAMRQSNEMEHGGLVETLNSDPIEALERRPSLWNAAARNEDGELLDLEVIDLVAGSPTLSRIPEEADPFGYVKADDAGAATAASPQDQPGDVDDSLLSLLEILPQANPKAPRRLPPESLASSQIASPPASQSVIRASEPTRPASPPEEAIEPTLPPLPEQPERPAYETYTDAQLAKQVSRYGFKPVKRRATMIALLDNCWTSQLASGKLTSVTPKRGIATTSAAGAASPKRPRGRPRKSATASTTAEDLPPSTQATTTTKRPRGRPRKDASTPVKPSASRAKKASVSPTRKTKGRATTKTQPTVPKTVLEIPDSESDQGSVATVSRSVSPEPTFSSPSGVDLSVSMGDDTELSLTMSPTEQQAALFAHITKAVTSAPRSMDVAKPSWYEQILMYDPIIVEDLAVWLNSGQLTSVGYDGEVSPAEVKKWCESKSVCCLWRDTQRGKERKRY